MDKHYQLLGASIPSTFTTPQLQFIQPSQQRQQSPPQVSSNNSSKLNFVKKRNLVA